METQHQEPSDPPKTKLKHDDRPSLKISNTITKDYKNNLNHQSNKL